jgi:hypothetical protein
MLISYVFRGEAIDIDVTRSEPYDWTFCGLTADEYNALNVTADEEEAIAARIEAVLHERAVYAGPDD